MLIIDKLSRKPIYEQIIEQIENLITQGVLVLNTPLPSVRTLSQELSVNPNTLQKAYTELERRGLCYSVPGSGRYITKNAKQILQNNKKSQILIIEQLTMELALLDVPIEVIIQSVKDAYNSTKIKKETGEKHDNRK